MTRTTPRLRIRLITLAFLLAILTVSAAPYALRGAPGRASFGQTTTPIAPGVQLTLLDRGHERGVSRAQVLTVDLSNPAISANLLLPGPVAAAEPLSAMAARSGAVAAINGDFFDMYHTNAPYGVEVASGQLLKGPIFSWVRAAGVGADRVGRLAEMHLTGAIAMPDGEYPLSGLNQHNIVANGVGMFTTAWGPAPRARAVEGAAAVRELTVQNGVVVGESGAAGSGWIAADSFVLLGRDEGAAALSRLTIGSPVSVRYAPNVDVAAPFNFALGGREVLLRDGQIPDLDDRDAEPRTAVGFSANGRVMFMATVDGRQQGSSGLTLRELAELMQSIGADDALNLDGGGSTTMLARKAGEWRSEIVNQPSGGRERPVPNGIGIFVAPGSGQLVGTRVIPALGEDADRTFAGLSRTLTAKGYDETFAPAAAGEITWQSLAPEQGWFEPGGVFRAAQPGIAQVQAQGSSPNGPKSGDPRAIQVLPLARVEVHGGPLQFASGAGPAFIAAMGYSPEGLGAQIEPRDMSLSYDPNVIEVVPIDYKHLQVTPRVPFGTTTLTIGIGGISTSVSVTIGLSGVLLSEFEDPAGWSAGGWLSASTLSDGPGMSGQGLRMVYDFTQSSEPRVASAQPTSPIVLPGRPVRIGLWVRGEGHGGQLMLGLQAADGQRVDVYGPAVTWSGWQHVELDVPQGGAYPLQLNAINIVESDPARQYSGQIAYDGLGIKTVTAP